MFVAALPLRGSKTVKFPKAPDTLVTLQIECVSCRELFTLAEDVANATTLGSWRMPTNGSGHTEMQPRPPLTHELVRPLTLFKTRTGRKFLGILGREKGNGR